MEISKAGIIDGIVERLGLDEETIEMLLGEYFSDSAEHIDLLKIAIAENDMEKVGHEAHYVKGSARNFGITPVSEVAEVIEHSARKGLDADYSERFEELLSVFNKVKEVTGF